jgi:HEAT repeat protein
VRVEAVSTLLRMGAQAWPAVPALVAHLNDPDATVRAFASSSLSMLGNPTLPAVSKVLASGDTNAQKAVLKFLAQNYRSLRLTGAPLRKLAQEGTPALRQQTIETLSLLRLDDDATVKMLAAALKDPAPEVRLAAVKAFACLPGKADAAIPALRSCLEDESSAVRAAAKELLQRVPEAAPGSAVSPAE